MHERSNSSPKEQSAQAAPPAQAAGGAGKRTKVQLRYAGGRSQGKAATAPRLDEKEHRAPVQASFSAGAGAGAGAGDGSAPEDAVQAAADRGTTGPASTLPHLDSIQGSFGKHDVTSVKAHVGGPAAEAASAMGAEAFATADHAAFRSEPDLHTAAHEAAHIVQQRGGVQLRGGVGEVGDRYEQHADRVADLVVRGESAEDTLSEMADASSSRSPGTQRKVQRLDEGGAAAAAGGGGAAPAAGGGAAAGPAGGGGAAPAPADPNAAGPACDPAVEEAKRVFRARNDLVAENYTPSTGMGKFDARYFPTNGLMPITLKLHFNFVAADNTPGFFERMGRAMRGQDNTQFFWSDAEKADFRNQFVSRVLQRWSFRHTIRSIKPCWTEFFANPLVLALPVKDAASAHFRVTVHKSPGPDIDYKSKVNNENLVNPANQPTADLWGSDVREEPDFNSGDVATQERERIDNAIINTNASPVQFGPREVQVPAAARAPLTALANALKQANPNAPRIPLEVEGWASNDGDPDLNQTYSEQRAKNVADFLTGLGIPQPVTHDGLGTMGAPNDPVNRCADIFTDTGYENTYSANRYSVAEHEVGHMLGLPDEYTVYNKPLLAPTQAKYTAMLNSAGINAPVYGQNTSSIMSAGVDVVPRHYATFWECLARMTTGTLEQADWRIG